MKKTTRRMRKQWEADAHVWKKWDLDAAMHDDDEDDYDEVPEPEPEAGFLYFQLDPEADE
jgi:hypothetical protein